METYLIVPFENPSLCKKKNKYLSICVSVLNGYYTIHVTKALLEKEKSHESSNVADIEKRKKHMSSWEWCFGSWAEMSRGVNSKFVKNN